jgi:hypothetical protein
MDIGLPPVHRAHPSSVKPTQKGYHILNQDREHRAESGRWRARLLKALCHREAVVQVATRYPQPVPFALFELARPFIAQTWLEAGHSCLARTGMLFGAADKFDCNSFVSCHKLPDTQMPAKGTKTMIVLGGT